MVWTGDDFLRALGDDYRMFFDPDETRLSPQTVADRHDLDSADVYQALAYYPDHPAENSAGERFCDSRR